MPATTPHYLDHAANGRLRPVARQAWLDAAQHPGNPSAVNAAGRAARRIVESARETIADLLSVNPTTITFTSGGTEADNLALIGGARAARCADPDRRLIMTSPLEHHAVLGAAHQLVDEGFELILTPLTEAGRINTAAAADLIRLEADHLALVSVISVNNETGIIQPVDRLAAAAAQAGVGFHSDRVQDPLGLAACFSQADKKDPNPAARWSGNGRTAFDQTETAASKNSAARRSTTKQLFRPDVCQPQTAFSLSAHKLGGPMGIGALVWPSQWPLTAINYGGGQENRHRSGTIPTPLVAAFAAAFAELAEQQSSEMARLQALQDRLTELLDGVGAVIIGRELPRSPAITYALFPGLIGQDLMVLLDQAGLSVSTGAACTAGVPQASEGLMALGLTQTEALSGLRFSFGWDSSMDDLAALEEALPVLVARLRQATRPDSTATALPPLHRPASVGTNTPAAANSLDSGSPATSPGSGNHQVRAASLAANTSAQSPAPVQIGDDSSGSPTQPACAYPDTPVTPGSLDTSPTCDPTPPALDSPSSTSAAGN
ncbi:MAG: aminotransferase class V-fold PLP-dependent enzyme [Propionibacteriaceae bacterium]|jgi:cysteine desulfurase|nr:aminotransferase class V-fold PLP-dependent enzyme [Propionibacteriaceae bacterium]